MCSPHPLLPRPLHLQTEVVGGEGPVVVLTPFVRPLAARRTRVRSGGCGPGVWSRGAVQGCSPGVRSAVVAMSPPRLAVAPRGPRAAAAVAAGRGLRPSYRAQLGGAITSPAPYAARPLCPCLRSAWSRPSPPARCGDSGRGGAAGPGDAGSGTGRAGRPQGAAAGPAAAVAPSGGSAVRAGGRRRALRCALLVPPRPAGLQPAAPAQRARPAEDSAAARRHHGAVSVRGGAAWPNGRRAVQISAWRGREVRARGPAAGTVRGPG